MRIEKWSVVGKRVLAGSKSGLEIIWIMWDWAYIYEEIVECGPAENN